MFSVLTGTIAVIPKLSAYMSGLVYSDAHSHLHLQQLASFNNTISAKYGECFLAAASESQADWETLKIWKNEDPERRAICFGFHPSQAEVVQLAAGIAELEDVLAKKEASAIGEIGLDYALPCNREHQRSLFVSQLSLAERLELPVVIHAVRCHDEMLKILSRFDGIRVLIHGFNGNPQMLSRYLERGCYVSLNASLLLRSSNTSSEPKWRQIVNALPTERLMLESDCCLDRSHQPKSLIDTWAVAELVASYKHIPVSEVSRIAMYNMRCFYNL